MKDFIWCSDEEHTKQRYMQLLNNSQNGEGLIQELCENACIANTLEEKISACLGAVCKALEKLLYAVQELSRRIPPTTRVFAGEAPNGARFLSFLTWERETEALRQALHASVARLTEPEQYALACQKERFYAEQLCYVARKEKKELYQAAQDGLDQMQRDADRTAALLHHFRSTQTQVQEWIYCKLPQFFQQAAIFADVDHSGKNMQTAALLAQCGELAFSIQCLADALQSDMQ